MSERESRQPAQTVYRAFREAAEQHPEREFVVHRTTRHSWGDTLRQVDRCARALQRAGINAGDRVGILSPTRPEAGIVLLACAKLGAVYLGMGTRLQRADMDYVCADAGPHLTFVMSDPALGDRTADMVAAAAAHRLAHPLVLSLTVDGSLSPEFEAFLSVGLDEDEDLPEPDQFDPLAIVYTSGSTGSPKGVVLSHRSLLNYRNLLQRNPLHAPRLVSDMPIDHIGYIGNELIAAILSGGTMIQVPRFDALEVAEAIERERATVWMGAIPTMLNRVVALDDLDRRNLSSLELVWWVGQVPERTVAAVAGFSDDIGASYGMSEMCCITLTDPGVSPAQAMTTVGRPLDDIEVRLRPVAGEQRDGEILLRRVGMMTEYWGKPDKTAEAIDPEGWFHTGDLGHQEEDGSLVITGRLKLLIRSGGYNLSPFEIESVIESHPDVAMAVVVGLPDPEYGETAHAVWSPTENASAHEGDLRSYSRERLSGFKVPKRFHLVERIPLLANGKPDRVGIRRLLSHRLPDAGNHDATTSREETMHDR